LLFDEKVNEEGFIYRVNNRSNRTNHFTVRIIRPKPEGILLALWKIGKISFRSVFSPGYPASIELKAN
jgi:hypothetical protein